MNLALQGKKRWEESHSSDTTMVIDTSEHQKGMKK
jgi:hypothetical protein